MKKEVSREKFLGFPQSLGSRSWVPSPISLINQRSSYIGLHDQFISSRTFWTTISCSTHHAIQVKHHLLLLSPEKKRPKKKNSVSNFFPSVYPPGINDGVLENPNRSWMISYFHLHLVRGYPSHVWLPEVNSIINNSSPLITINPYWSPSITITHY